MKINLRLILLILNLGIVTFMIIGLHTFNLVIGLLNFEKIDECNQILVPLPVWIITNSLFEITFYVFAMSLIVIMIWTNNKIAKWFYTAIFICEWIFLIIWTIVGILMLFLHFHTCYEHMKMLWIIIMITIVIQIIVLFLTICCRCFGICIVKKSTPIDVPENILQFPSFKRDNYYPEIK